MPVDCFTFDYKFQLFHLPFKREISARIRVLKRFERIGRFLGPDAVFSCILPYDYNVEPIPLFATN